MGFPFSHYHTCLPVCMYCAVHTYQHTYTHITERAYIPGHTFPHCYVPAGGLLVLFMHYSRVPSCKKNRHSEGMYVCVYVYIYVCIRMTKLYLYVCIYVYVLAGGFSMHAYMHACLYVGMYVSFRFKNKNFEDLLSRMYVCICMSVCICPLKHVRAYMHTFLYVTCMCTYID
jgi:hypothetical protein